MISPSSCGRAPGLTATVRRPSTAAARGGRPALLVPPTSKGVTVDITDRLAGKVALVTGGSRGIGAEIARRLAAEGADVGFTYHTGKDEAQQVAAQVRGLGGRALAVEADLAEPAAAAAVVDAVAGQLGRPDILVNNAGVMHWSAVAQTRLEDIDRLISVNARAPFLMMRAAAATLADGGRVVNIS